MDADALRALMLQIEWGADEALAEMPVNRLAPAGPATALAPVQPRPAARLAPAAAPSLAGIDGTAALRAAIEGFEGCALRDTATGAVTAEGGAASGLLAIYGPPSDADDRARRPLSGPAGKFFDAMLASIGLDRAQVLVAPLIPWRPPGGRPPSAQELALCLPFLHRVIALARPRLVLLLGTQAARAVLGPERRARGQVLPASVPDLGAPVRCIAVPAVEELLRDPGLRPGAWAALRLAIRLLQSNNTEM